MRDWKDKEIFRRVRRLGCQKVKFFLRAGCAHTNHELRYTASIEHATWCDNQFRYAACRLDWPGTFMQPHEQPCHTENISDAK